MSEEAKGQTSTATHPRRPRSGSAPLGTLLLAKALGLTTDEARQLRADVAETRTELGTIGTLRMVVSETVDAARMWLEANDE